MNIRYDETKFTELVLLIARCVSRPNWDGLRCGDMRPASREHNLNSQPSQLGCMASSREAGQCHLPDFWRPHPAVHWAHHDSLPRACRLRCSGCCGRPRPRLCAAGTTTDTSVIPSVTAAPTTDGTVAASLTSSSERPSTPPTTAAATTTTAPPITAAVPAYFTPSPLWDVMLGTANTGDVRVSIAVMNPANGPGVAPDAGYARVIALAKQKGVRVLGYVATGYGAGTAVLADIDSYKRFYGVTDIFLDEATVDCPSLRTYQPWIAAVRANGGLAAVNPGIIPAACWADAADIIVTFEGPFDSYLRYQGPPWASGHPSSRFWNIVYAVPPGSASFVRDLAGRHRVGLLYATEDVLPNPYDTLPAALSVTTVPPPTTPPETAPLGTAPPTTIPPVLVVPTSAPDAATPLIIVLDASTTSMP